MPDAITSDRVVIDSREVIERITELENLAEGDGIYVLDEDETAELAALRALAAEGEMYAGDWRGGAGLIRDSYFEDYAREFAEDIGAIQKDGDWPTNRIDWAAAADDLKVDYTEVTFDGVAYWVRA
jgi:hypothetical protein